MHYERNRYKNRGSFRWTNWDKRIRAEGLYFLLSWKRNTNCQSSLIIEVFQKHHLQKKEFQPFSTDNWYNNDLCKTNHKLLENKGLLLFETNDDCWSLAHLHALAPFEKPGNRKSSILCKKRIIYNKGKKKKGGGLQKNKL